MKGDLELRGSTLTATMGVNHEVLLFRNKLSEDRKQRGLAWDSMVASKALACT